VSLNQDNPSDLMGKQVRLHTRQGDTVAEGKIIAYTEAPTIVIEKADGSRISWRADLATMLPADLQTGAPE
jgi:hypothetical protein